MSDSGRRRGGGRRARVAERLGAVYLDGDNLHPPENIAKMSRGEPLTDADRAPWLGRVGETLRTQSALCLVGCSALKRIYRDTIREAAGEAVGFLHLAGSRDVIAERMGKREGHFMPLTLLDSQFAALQALEPDEEGIAVEIDQPLEAVVQDLLAVLAPA